MSRDVVRSLEEAIAVVVDGDLIALQHPPTQLAPMASVRELIRQGRRRLGLVCLDGGIGIDWLVAAGAADRVIGAAGSMGDVGRGRRHRTAAGTGEVHLQQVPRTALLARLGAGARNLPFLPAPVPTGTDPTDLAADLAGDLATDPGDVTLIDDPFGGPPVVACRALVPDVALLHAHRADRFGNVAVNPATSWPDLTAARAARHVIVTVEEVVGTEVLRRHPERTTLPGSAVDAVVEVPWGAHPTSCPPAYGHDVQMHAGWGRVRDDDTGAEAFMRAHLEGAADQADYLDRAGGPQMLARVSRWAALVEDANTGRPPDRDDTVEGLREPRR